MEADGSTRVVSYGDAGPDARPLDENSVFEIGSITKAFTGILLADMVARGEVSLTAPVSEYLPSGVSVPSRGGRMITLLDLATHHSALPRMPTNFSPGDVRNPYADYTDEDLFAFLGGHTLRRDIGSEYEYSNLAVGLLGVALAHVAGESYEALVRTRILEPLGMTMTGFALSDAMRERVVRGHSEQGAEVPMWDFDALAPAGALRSNMTDMLTFIAANTGPPATELERAMRASHQVRDIISPEMRIGMNWHIRMLGADRIVWHNGGTAGFRTFAGFDPESGVGAVVLTNSGHGADDIGMHLINPDFPLAPAPVVRTEVSVPESVLSTYVGEYELTPQFSIAVTLEDGALWVQATGQPAFPIFAASETRFFLRAVEAEVTFTKDAAGMVTGLILHQGGVDQVARKVG
jgi:CubicO group peptidase (beta-lactamase class C family)